MGSGGERREKNETWRGGRDSGAVRGRTRGNGFGDEGRVRILVCGRAVVGKKKGGGERKRRVRRAGGKEWCGGESMRWGGGGDVRGCRLRVIGAGLEGTMNDGRCRGRGSGTRMGEWD